MSKFIDFIINLCKWPVAIILLVYLPALIQSYHYFNFHNAKFYAMAGGALFYGVTILFAGYNTCASMQIISHELTHTVFAYLTFHNAGRIRVNPDGSGGSMALKGIGNWMISLAPYFFPLFAFIYMLILPGILIMASGHWLVYSVLGYFIAYYWATVISQVHSEQTDIIKEGYVFSGIIIVCLNALVTGILFAFTNKSWSGVEHYLQIVQKLTVKNILWVLDLIEHYV